MSGALPWSLRVEIDEVRAEIRNLSSNPWQHLLFWEVPYKVADGLKVLFRTPFYHQGATFDPHGGIRGPVSVPTRLWYPEALHSGVPERVEPVTTLIPFLVTQAREHYAAARYAVISGLSRPILHFYAAEALALAVSTSLFGVRPQADQTHGLKADPKHPELITWKQHGMFARFYQSVRADTLYNFEPRFLGKCPERPWSPPQINVDDCLAALGLTPSRFAQGVVPLVSSPRDESEVLVLPPIVLEYLVLYYFSIMARYHPAGWQTLLQGNSERSLPIRQALAQVPDAFVNDLLQFLPVAESPVQKQWFHPQPEWTEDWDLTQWAEPSQAELIPELLDHPSAFGFLDEWQPGRGRAGTDPEV